MQFRTSRLGTIASLALAMTVAFLPRVSQATTITITSTAEDPVRFFSGTSTYFDVSFAGAPSSAFGPCPVFCTFDLTEGVAAGQYTNTEMWSFGPRPGTTLNQTETLAYDLSITLDGVTVTQTITHDLNIDYHSYNDSIFMDVLGGPVTTFDFGAAGKIDVWVPSNVYALTSAHNGSGGQFYTEMKLYDVSPVPEPASALLLLPGLLFAGWRRRMS